MDTWGGSLGQDIALAIKLQDRMEFLSKEANMLVLDDKPKERQSIRDKFLKIAAINTALRVTVEEAKFALETGSIERKPQQIQASVSLSMPFKASPEIKAAYTKSAEMQRAEKDANPKPPAAEAGH